MNSNLSGDISVNCALGFHTRLQLVLDDTVGRVEAHQPVREDVRRAVYTGGWARMPQRIQLQRVFVGQVMVRYDGEGDPLVDGRLLDVDLEQQAVIADIDRADVVRWTGIFRGLLARKAVSRRQHGA